jgi:hypothetical protein
MNTKTDLLAKLLANENLTVVQEPVRTASFDIKNRVLRIPQWKEMNDDLMDMLVGHEVGHALYTTTEFWDNNIAEKYPHIHGYFNVCEDVRIEKLMKRRYPGLRRSFNLGYKDLNQRDFFNVAKSNFKDMLLIDKINLYYKAGYACGVEFTPEEKEFVRRAEATETIQEVITLSIDIYNYSKDALDKKMQSMQEDMEEMKAEDMEFEDAEGDDFDENDVPFESDEQQEADEDETENESDGAGEEEKEDESDLESKTEKALRKKLDELSDTETTYTYYSIPEKFNIQNPVVGYKDVISKISNLTQEERDWLALVPQNKDKFDKFLLNSKRVVNYLIKEFEMKKSAELLRRAKIAKTGSLDGKKLYSYKLNDDIFKQVMTIPQGKNHGMLFLLDWSGSMDQAIQPTIEQVVNLAMFCRGIQIPFQVFAFTDHYYVDSDVRVEAQPNPNKLHIGNKDFKLLELFSNKMTNSEFNYMVENITHPTFTHRTGFRLGGTPLNQALTYLYNYIPKFKSENKVEKLTLITLTDGEGNNLYGWNSLGERTAIKSGRRYLGRNEGKDIYIREIPHLQDKVTKKNYRIEEESDVTKGLLQMIKDRFEITVLGFYITRTSYYNLATALYAHYGSYQRATAVELTEMRKTMKKDGFVSLKNTGRDDLFLIPLSSTKIQDDGVLETSAKDSAAKIARNFSKFLNTKKESRVLLSKFVSWVA